MVNILKSFNRVTDTGDKEQTTRLQEEWDNDLKQMDERLKEEYKEELNEIENKLKKTIKPFRNNFYQVLCKCFLLLLSLTFL